MSKNFQSQYFDLKVDIQGIFHKFEIFHKPGGIYSFEKKFKKNYRER